MIPNNLMDYVKVYKEHVPQKICALAVKNLNKINWEKHSFYNSRDNTLTSYDTDLAVSFDNFVEKQKINDLVWFAIERYILKDFKDFNSWFPGWEGYTIVRFNKYDKNTEMKIHCDHINSMFDGHRRGVPILTVLGALNNDYEGGEFVMFGDQEIQLPAGSVVVFPSNFMFPHEVKPVKKGVRFSYVSWVW